MFDSRDCIHGAAVEKMQSKRQDQEDNRTVVSTKFKLKHMLDVLNFILKSIMFNS